MENHIAQTSPVQGKAVRLPCSTGKVCCPLWLKFNFLLGDNRDVSKFANPY